MIKGHCLCKSVSYQTSATPLGPSLCHCGQCRRQSGHLWGSAYVAKSELTIAGPVKWYDSSPQAQRGFCPNCGSALFWHAHDEDTMSFSLGSLTDTRAIRLEKHIFTSDKGDYYDIADDLPKKP